MGRWDALVPGAEVLTIFEEGRRLGQAQVDELEGSGGDRSSFPDTERRPAASPAPLQRLGQATAWSDDAMEEKDCVAGRPAKPVPPPARLEAGRVRERGIPSAERPLGEAGDDAGAVGPDEVRAAREARLRDLGEREAAIRERRLDIEASLAAIGASGLPYAPRHPNRFQSPLDANRLRGELEALREELDALAAERRIVR